MVAMEERVSKLEGAYEQVHERLGDMNSRLDTTNETIEGLRRDMLSEIGGLRRDMLSETGGLRAEMNGRLLEVNGRLDSMDKRLNTIMIAALTAAGGIIAGLIAGLIGLVVFVLNVM